MPYKFSERSLEKLEGVHTDLVRVMEKAIVDSPYDFGITEGLRTKERQLALVMAGASQTTNSRHITGHAVDIVVYCANSVSWKFFHYAEVAVHILDIAEQEGVEIIWGGTWKTLRDGPHFELSRKVYP